MKSTEKQKPPVNKNDIVNFSIDTIGSEGQGIGRLNGYTLFCEDALPGEEVEAIIIKTKPNYGIAKLVRILRYSDDRVEPKCFQSKKCGGCSLQHMSYSAQLLYKQKLVEDALKKLGGFSDIIVPPVIGMRDNANYRNKGSFPIGVIDAKVSGGFYSKHSHRIVPVGSCTIQNELTLSVLEFVCNWASENSIEPYDEVRHSGVLRHAIARVTSKGECMVIIVCTKPPKRIKELAELLCKAMPEVTSVYLNINDKDTNVITGENYRLLYGKSKLTEYFSGLAFEFGPASFLQVNHSQTEILYNRAIDLLNLNGTETIIDAYCGIGTISLLLAKSAKHVTGIEYIAQAVDDAKANAKLNGITNADFLCGDAGEIISGLIDKGIIPDILTIDPPRKGASEEFINAVISCKIPKVLYISCNPATLARDLKLLAGGGYNIKHVQPVDMFPMTNHVECIALISRVKE